MTGRPGLDGQAGALGTLGTLGSLGTIGSLGSLGTLGSLANAPVTLWHSLLLSPIHATNAYMPGWLLCRSLGLGIYDRISISTIAKSPNIRCFVAKLHFSTYLLSI